MFKFFAFLLLCAKILSAAEPEIITDEAGNDFYTRPITGTDLHFCIEKVISDDLKDKFAVWAQAKLQILKNDAKRKRLSPEEKQKRIAREADYQNAINTFTEELYDKNLDSDSEDDDSKPDVWVAYISNKKLSDSVTKTDMNCIEIIVTTTYPDCYPVIRNMGIFKVNLDSHHKNISPILHCFTAWYMKKIYPTIEYMINCPLEHMQKMLEELFPNQILKADGTTIGRISDGNISEADLMNSYLQFVDGTRLSTNLFTSGYFEFRYAASIGEMINHLKDQKLL